MLTKTNSKLSPQVRLALIISVVCALIIAITVFAITILFKRKYTAKFINPKEEVELAKLKLENPNYGIVLSGIKKFYSVVEDDFFVAFVINTIYLNKYKSVLVNNISDYLSISISALANGCKVDIFKNNLKEKCNELIKKEFNDIDKKNISYLSKINPDKKYNLIISFDKKLNMNDNIFNYQKNLSEGGMMIVNMNNLQELKEQKNILLLNNFRYETIKFHRENVIILTKDINSSSNNQNKHE